MTTTHSDVPAARRLGTAPAVDELRSRQLEHLRWTLHHAYTNVAFNRKKFDDAGVHPDDCRELADLAKFPRTTKQDLREAYPFGMFAVPHEQVRRIHASSGTTGKLRRAVDQRPK